MKGPYERIKYDLRRVWACPVCNRQERTEGNIASKLCKCQFSESPTKRLWMKLVEDGIRPMVVNHSSAEERKAESAQFLPNQAT